MGLFSSGKSAIDKLAEEKAKLELAIMKKPKPQPKPPSTRMGDESAEDYGRRLMKHRRTGLY